MGGAYIAVWVLFVGLMLAAFLMLTSARSKR